MRLTDAQTARLLLTRGLNRPQRLLYTRQIEALRLDYLQWRRAADRDREIRARNIPRHARGRAQAEYDARWGEATARDVHARQMFDFLVESSLRIVRKLDEEQHRYIGFQNALVIAATETERRQVILDYARHLGASRRSVRADARAFGRNFGEEAVSERFQRRRGERQLLLVFALDRIGALATRVVRVLQETDRASDTSHESDSGSPWQRMRVEQVARRILAVQADPRIQAAALRCMRCALRGFGPNAGRHLIDANMRNDIQRAAADAASDVWVQCEAMSLLDVVAPDALDPILVDRITGRPSEGTESRGGPVAAQGDAAASDQRGGPGDAIFVRRHVVRLLFEQPRRLALARRLFASLAEESSPFVRQQLARSVWRSGADEALEWCEQLMRRDPDRKVRAATMVAFLETASHARTVPFLEQLADCLRSETDPFVLRTALHVVAEWLDAVQFRKLSSAHELLPSASGERVAPPRCDREAEEIYRTQLLPAIRSLHGTTRPIAVRRWAAQAAQRIEVLLDVRLRGLLWKLRAQCASLRQGCGRRLPRRVLDGVDADGLGRVLAVMAQQDHGYALEHRWYGPRIVRGSLFGVRAWRVLYEACHAAVDKRSGHRHTVGRLSRAEIRAPSQILAEMSPTKVPGEPLFIPEEDGWRPYLPLPDDLVSALNMSWYRPRRVRFYTSEGVTELTAPRRLISRLRAGFRLATRLPRLARLRNWNGAGNGAPTDYLAAVEKLGFRVRFRGYDSPTRDTMASDPGVLRFFPCLIGFVPGPWLTTVIDASAAYVDYFGSAFENSMLQLLLFIIATLTLFLAGHFWANRVLGKARRQIPLSIGGWGTRGKSGTERLKAALLADTGHCLVSKTTGCEATIIQNDPFGDPVEIPLFRPYDRATIWEHQRVVALAAKMKVSAFLWECMGLIPEYVTILQRQWTRDDLATITNTYPDHENLQGPAGHDVAHSIAHFVPRRARLLTTERQMIPILADACRQQKTSMRCVDWLASGLITDDVLDRFPYAEHPDNVALVVALADELKIDRDVALKAMADRMVPDLGVLKTFPVATVEHCQLEFTNGMSANERFGCMGNWKRIGFDEHDPRADPSVWITTVVNNRADRITRTKMFAQILVDDIEVDRHFLIGTNLRGLQRHIVNAWEDRMRQIRLFDDLKTPDRAKAIETLDTMARQLRQPTAREQIGRWLDLLSRGTLGSEALGSEAQQHLPELWDRPEAFADWLRGAGADPVMAKRAQGWHAALLRAYQDYRELVRQIRTATPNEVSELNKRFRSLMGDWFFGKLLFIEDPQASGDEIIRRMVDATPPGCRNRAMGLQNIKGTGLDFVYRFQQWDACHAACRAIGTLETRAMENGLQALCDMPTYGRLGWQAVEQALETARNSSATEQTDIRFKIDAIANKLAMARRAVDADATSDRGAGGGRLSRWCRAAIRQWRDVNAAARRRTAADRIYRDLATERISRRQALGELRKLAQAQQNG
ncbi:MAG: hypothetical protein ACC645_02895 [Pirellulales bacterium]